MATHPVEQEWLRPKEAAAYLGISLSTLYSWRRKGIIRFYRLGPRAMGLRRDDLEQLSQPTGPSRALTGRRGLADRLWELNEEMRRRYGIMPDSTPFIRAERERQGEPAQRSPGGHRT